MAPPSSPGAYGGAGLFEMGLTWALTVVATATVVARTYVSLKTLDRPSWDVFWAIITYVTCLVAQIMQTIAAAYGIGNHQLLLTPSDLKEGNKWNWLGRMIGIFAATLGKNVVIALLLRIQGETHRRKAWILHGVWISNVVLCIVIVVVLCLRCRPIELWWDKSLDGTCNAIDSSSTKILGTFQGAWMAASDIVLAIYPLFIFWNLNLSLKRKAGLCALMSGGLIAGVCGALKTVQVRQAYKSRDVSYSIYPLLVTTLVESWMILILACIPPLRYLFVKAFRKTKASLPGASAADSKRSKHPSSHARRIVVHMADIPRESIAWNTRRKQPQTSNADLENESEEEILPRNANGMNEDVQSSVANKGRSAGDRGITITQEYDVSFETGGHPT